MIIKSIATSVAAFVCLASVPGCPAAESITVTVSNPLDVARSRETIAIPVRDLGTLKPDQVTVKCGETVLPSQAWANGGDGAAGELLFQADFGPRESKSFTVQAGAPPVADPKVFGRLVPERKDDFAWENDYIAFRIYGRALEQELVSSGVDVWCKRTRNLIVNRFYKSGDYHKDHGEGLDCYSVKTGCGCGGTAIVKNDTLFVSRNFTNWKLLANGPVRVAFELTYEPWEAGGEKVSETKRVILDAGQNLNRFECAFTSDHAGATIPVGIGLGQHRKAQPAFHRDAGWMRVWELTDFPTAGSIGCGVVLNPASVTEMKEIAGHMMAVVQASQGKPVAFYAGAGWEQSGDFPNLQAWDDYLALFAKRLQSPLKISISKN